jgi:serralysin
MAKDFDSELSAISAVSAIRQAALRESSDVAGSAATTARVAIGDTYTGTISAGDRDWVAVTLQAGQAYVFTAYGTGGSLGISDTTLTLRNSFGTQVAFNDDADREHGLLFSALRFTPPSSGTYYLDVRGFQFATGQYTLRTATDVFTVEQVASQLTDMGWGLATSALELGSFTSGSVTVNLTGLTLEGQELARMALETWTAYTGTRFVETTNSATITFDDNRAGAFAGPLDFNPLNGIYQTASVNVGTSVLSENGTTFGSYSYLIYLHEIGHALGLGHAGFYDGNASYGFDNHYRNDSYQMTIMSYFDMVANTFVNATDFLPLTPMAADIAAMQYLYGASSTAFEGDTTWGANSNITGRLGTAMGVMFDGDTRPSWIAARQEFGFTIVDANGIDTMDFRGTIANQIIDMRAGGISDVYGRVGTVVVALGTIIENAHGGSGADTIYGNDADNMIWSYAGADFVPAGQGNDTVNTGPGNDTVWAAGGNDMVDAGEGDDEVWGGLGNDTLLGDQGNDLLGGSDGNDSIDGGAGRDRVWGGAGRDTVLGGEGHDEIAGGAGDDLIGGGDGNDTIFAAPGNDTVFADDGDDFIWAGSGNDLVFAGTGNDTITPGTGDDTISGGAGADVFIFYATNGTNLIEDFSFAEGDRLHLWRGLWVDSVGALTPAQVESRFASVNIDGNVTLTFGAAGTTIVLAGVTDVSTVDQFILIF